MARGWESKSVEEQQSERQTVMSGTPKPAPSPEQAARDREIQGLQLSCKHLRQRLQAGPAPQPRQQLESALAELEARLAQLG